MSETAQDAEQTGDDQPKPAPDRIQFHYIKSNAFRVIHVDGIVGGPTAHGQFAVSFWSERVPIPKVMTFGLKDGAIGDELKAERIALDGIVREVECCATFDYPTARLIRDWLDKKIELVEKMIRSQMDKPTEEKSENG